MSDEQNEGFEEEIEDLEAPAATLANVVGGAGNPCAGNGASIATDGHVYLCIPPTCLATKPICAIPSEAIVIKEQ